jgi:hypothetical protein
MLTFQGDTAEISNDDDTSSFTIIALLSILSLFANKSNAKIFCNVFSLCVKCDADLQQLADNKMKSNSANW